MPRLAGKNVLVTGASSGIGQAIAVRFAGEGANVAINFRSKPEQAEQTRDMARSARNGSQGSREILIQADVSDEADVRRMFTEAIGGVRFFGRVDQQCGHPRPRRRIHF